jgi:hypothetical protein
MKRFILVSEPGYCRQHTNKATGWKNLGSNSRRGKRLTSSPQLPVRFWVQPALLVACIKANFTLSLVIVDRTQIKKKTCYSTLDSVMQQLCQQRFLSLVHIYQCYIMMCGIRIPIFLYPSRPALESTQPPVQLELGLFFGGKAAGT